MRRFEAWLNGAARMPRGRIVKERMKEDVERRDCVTRLSYTVSATNIGFVRIASVTVATASPGENGLDSSLHRGEKAHLSQPVSKPVMRMVAASGRFTAIQRISSWPLPSGITTSDRTASNSCTAQAALAAATFAAT
jgi:hypothetical protein